MNKLTLPNLLSGSRLLLAAPSFACIYFGEWVLSAVIILLAVASDMLDGRIARRRNQVSTIGGLLDHGADAIFVTITLSGLAAINVVPALLPILVITAFTQYVLDSDSLQGQPLRASKIGRYNGVAYFVLAGFPSMQHALGLYLLPDYVFYWTGWLLIATSIVSMADRLMALYRSRH